MKRFLRFIFGIIRQRQDENFPNCPEMMCPFKIRHNGKIMYTGKYCQKCGVSIRLGDYKLDVKGSDHKEVESVSLRLIEELSGKIKPNENSTQEKHLKGLNDLSLSLKNGEIINCLNGLIDFCMVNNLIEFEEETLALSSRFSNLKKSKRNGTISENDFIINQNKIISSIAEILKLINKELK